MTLYSAILNPSGPNFELWNQVLGSHRVPLESERLEYGEYLDGRKDVPVYRVNIRALTLRQRAKLFNYVSDNYRVSLATAEQVITKNGLPIEAADVIVNFPVEVAL